MLILTIVPALLALSAETAQTQVRHTESLFCDRELRSAGKLFAIARLEVDKHHRPLRRSLRLFGGGYRATWELPTERFDTAQPPDELAPDTLALPRDTSFPVTVAIRFDGSAVWQRRFEAPNVNVLVVLPAPQPKGTSFQPGLDFTVGAGQVPSLFGLRRADVVVTAGDGAEVMRKDLPMSEWSSLEKEIADAFAAVEVERERRQCEPHAMVTAV